MQPSGNRPAIRIEPQADTQPFTTVEAALERHQRAAAPVLRAVPPKLAKMLLPGEHVTFGTVVHPIVFALPFALFIAIVALDLTVPLLIVERGITWLRHGIWPEVGLGLEIAVWAAWFALVTRRAFRFLALRVVSTNRRIFAIRGVIVRRITPLGNTALAGSTVSQGVLGRMFGYGSIDLPLAEGTPERFRDMRDVLQLYREFQAVANGVEGDLWVPAVRQTIIP